MALDVAQHQGRLPDPEAPGARQAARLPRLGGVVAEADAVLDAMDEHVPRPLRQHPPRRVHDRGGGDRRLRGRARQGGGVHRCRVDADEIVFVRNATEAINLVAYSWARHNLQQGDVVVLTHMEHHANVVPWHILAAERGVELRWIPLTDDYRLDLDATSTSCSTAPSCSPSPRCRTCSARSTTSRALADAAHAAGAPVARRRVPGGPPLPVDVQALGRRLRRLLRRTRCAARPASARSGRAGSCSRRCRRSSVAAR